MERDEMTNVKPIEILEIRRYFSFFVQECNETL